MRIGVVILPIYPGNEARARWRDAEAAGFDSAWTYDHLAWRTFRDRTWFGTVPTLAAAAGATARIRLGTLVSSPNFRHPVTFAKDVMTLDDLSDGRITLGIGAGGTGFDATVLGREAWSPRERQERFEEFVDLLDRLLTAPATTYNGRYYAADEARMIPGCVQHPRVPFAVAATGPRGMRVAARYGRAWVTFGDPRRLTDRTPADYLADVADQIRRLGDICAADDRDPAGLDRVLLHGSTDERSLDSVDAFVDYVGRYAEIGITEIVVHLPVPGTVFDTDPGVFDRVVAEGLPQVRAR
ncbi:LLM class flavin-dependent oxidoreductase [Yinghuangia sp. ASG 101]|uniref:LLM class flavin-dependent oxidoreductase n=1 Tax=Yinghuangia sp. ASG 101 TaxID=2896848 RepID=UPI001E5A602D|nr:LLM class flavin-dependent oxidoreductase [Yinghuangia sp. ASG 101]UGQ15214.1 LLM class flavin-dependent oxidoreductase [Yinghuangia sp. ASG 101]